MNHFNLVITKLQFIFELFETAETRLKTWLQSMSASILKYIHIKGVQIKRFAEPIFTPPWSGLGTCQSGNPYLGTSWSRDPLILASNSHCCVLMPKPKTSNERHQHIISSKYSLFGARLAKLARAQKSDGALYLKWGLTSFPIHLF